MAKAKESQDTKEKQIKHAQVVAEAAPAPIEEPETKEEQATAKAGKRSAKAVKDTQEKQAKQARKVTAGAEQPKARPVPVSKTRAERAGKKYREALKEIDKSKEYSLADALELAAKSSTTKFDATIELHINLGVDPRQADQNVRDTVALPAGTGKKVRIAVLADAAEATKAKAAGADIAGEDEVFTKLDEEEIGFDILIAMPAMMPRLGKYARLLGPRGLMPNPKSGTVAADTSAAVQEARAGRVEYRVDQSGIIHLGIGKASFGKDKLNQNAEAVMASVRAAKPASLKGLYIKSIYASSTMGPSVKIAI